jgi:predicted kinase
MPKLVIIRGLPGSGKTKFAKELEARGYYHYETDMFFTKNGEYKWNPNQKSIAHKWCLDKCRRSLEMGCDVVVSNTFTKKSYLKPYLDMAAELGVEVFTIIANGHYKSSHGVSDEVMDKMAKEWED